MTSKDSGGPASCDQSELAQQVQEWIFANTASVLPSPPKASTPLSHAIDCGLDFQEAIQRACIELFRFRPTTDDIRDALDSRRIRTLQDFGALIVALQKVVPAEETEVHLLDETNCAAESVPLWQLLLNIPPDRYNDQFVIKCYLDTALVTPSAPNQNPFFPAVLNNADKQTLFIHTDLDKYLHQFDFQFISTNMKDFAARRGDVLQFEKQTAADSFVHFVLVSGKTKFGDTSFEFKPTNALPIQASWKGIRNFFLRDCDTKLSGYWRKSE